MPTYTRVSVASGGTQGDDNSGFGFFQPGGSRISFYSGATNLIGSGNDTNHGDDVFIRNIGSDITSLVTVSSSGDQQNGASIAAFGQLNPWSPDGLNILFGSSAMNLSPAATGGTVEIYKRSFGVEGTTLISSDASGVAANQRSFAASFSPILGDTRVVFDSFAANLVPGSGSDRNVYIKNYTTGAVTLVSSGSSQAPGNGASQAGSFSQDGARVVFHSTATNLVAGDSNNSSDIFIKGVQGTTASAATLVSTNVAGVQGNGSSTYGQFSPDGSKVAFISAATNLVSAVLGTHVYVKDLASGVVTLVDSNTDGLAANSSVSLSYTVPFAWSSDGTRLLFSSAASNLVAGDANSADDLYIKDLASGRILRVSSLDAGEPNGASGGGAFSPDGGTIVFQSDATNLIGGDTNRVKDVFTTAAPTFTAFTNTAPTISDTAAGQMATAGTAVRPFLPVVLADPDGGQTETITISYDTANGVLAGNGFFAAADGTLRGGFRSLGIARGFVQSLTFTPTAGRSATTSFTVSVFDGLTTTSDSRTSVVADAPANTAPAIGGTQAGQTDTAGAPVSPFSAVTVADPDTGQMETVTVSFTAANGAFSAAGLSGSGGTYTGAFASAAAAQAALRGASFTPASGQNSTTTFTLSVSDGQATATDGETSVVATYTPPTPGAGTSGGGSAGGVTTTPASVQYGLMTQVANLSRAAASGADAQTSGSPIYVQLQAERAIADQLDHGRISLAQAEAALNHLVDGTTAVAVSTYAFFTGFTPTAAGITYLVHSAANANDLNDVYYAKFSTENRYINFAVNLATGGGVGVTSFQESYGGLSLADATARAYAAVFGATADAVKVSALLDALVPDGLGGQETRAQYFAQYGGDGPNGQGTKAAMIGFLLSNAVHDGSGVYGLATENYLSALAHGTTPAMGSELALHYGATVNLVGVTPIPDPAVGG